MDTLTITLALFFCFLVSLYFYITKNNNHWKSKGVTEIPPSLFFGSIKERFLGKTSFHEFYSKMYFKGKDEPYLGFFEGMNPSLMIRDPDLIRSVLSKDFDNFVNRGGPVGDQNPHITKMMIILRGDEWKQVRTTVAPTFSTGRIRRMNDMIEDCAQQLQDYIKSLIHKNGGQSTGEIDLKDTMSKFTLDVIASTAFGVTCNSFSDEKSEFAEKISKFNNIPKWQRFLFLATLIFNIPTKIRDMLPISFFNIETVSYLANIIKETTKYRLENKVRRNDFLQLLMDAQNISSETGDHVDKNDQAISEDVAIAQSVLFFIAGYETSSTLLTMVCYELAQNTPEQDKLRSEVRDKIEQNGKLSYDDLNDLPYLDKILSETLRLHPPVARLDRVCTKDIKIGNVELKKDDKVCIPVFGLHMDPKYFADPHLFNPERFSDQEKSKRHSYVFLPFGQGPRNCIGMRFALTSVKLCLAYLVNNFVINVCTKTEVPFKYDKRSMLLKSDGGVFIEFSPC